MTDSVGTILIVDDEVQNRKLLEALLAPEGYATVSAANGEEAFAVIARCPPDLILLDVMMPGMDGHQVTRTLKSDPATQHIPIIMVTAQGDRPARLAGLDAGAEDFLSKPVDRAELWLRVRNLLRLKTLSDFFVNHSLILEQQVLERTAHLQRFRTAMDATVDAIILIDRVSMRFVEVNATACRMLGYRRDELLGMGPQHLGGPDLELLVSIYDAMIGGGGSNELPEVEVQRKDGSRLSVEVRRHAQLVGRRWIIVSVLHDVTERKEAEKRLDRLTHFDPITGLPNRSLFYESLQKTLAQAADRAWLIAVLIINIDDFKVVNDRLGHAMGDELLVQFSNRLLQCVRIRDTVGHLGGDEFALILVLEDGEHGATLVASKVRDMLRTPFDLEGHKASVTVSIGITVFPNDALDPETLIRYASTGMFRAKRAGRDSYCFYTAQMNTDALAQQALETALTRAVENGEFVLHYQPKVWLHDGRIAGLETLIRWQRPGYGLVPPQAFIPVLEETGLIVDVGKWVIAASCEQIGRWLRSSIGPMQVSVNVSGRQFAEGKLDWDVLNAIDANSIPADLLELELTESTVMEDTERTFAILRAVKECGVKVSIDDFGTGYSSLAYLRRFAIDTLKIDIAFIRDIARSADDAAIALAIIRMAHSLKLGVVAEGVETAEQLAFLGQHGCDQMQGDYFSGPLPVSELEEMIRQDKRLLRPESETPVPPAVTALGDEPASATT